MSVLFIGIGAGVACGKIYLDSRAKDERPPPPIIPGDLEALQRTFNQVSNYVLPSIVHLRTPDGEGSGVIVNKEGYILTNLHVVQSVLRTRDQEVTAIDYDGISYPCEVFGYDRDTDIAVLKPLNPPSEITPAELGDSDEVNVGDWVLAVGSPFGLRNSVTAGIVSAKHRRASTQKYENYIQTDAAINPGNSGGALVNLKGKVIGINTMIVVGDARFSSRSFAGVGLAIPINTAKYVMERILKEGRVRRGFLGVQLIGLQEIVALSQLGQLPEGLEEYYDKLHDVQGKKDLMDALKVKSLDGGFVVTVVPGSPASKSGVKQGDIITKIDGVAVKDVDDIRDRIAKSLPGTTISITLMREGKEITLSATLSELK